MIDAATDADVRDVALRMRADDFAEFSAVSFAEDRTMLAGSLAERYGARPEILCGRFERRPVCIGGAVQSRPNVATLLFFATDEFPMIALEITRFVRRRLLPALTARGVHRVEAVSLASHVRAHAWLKTLGLRPETGPLNGYGKGGEAFIQFSRVSDALSSRA